MSAGTSGGSKSGGSTHRWIDTEDEIIIPRLVEVLSGPRVKGSKYDIVAKALRDKYGDKGYNGSKVKGRVGTLLKLLKEFEYVKAEYVDALQVATWNDTEKKIEMKSHHTKYFKAIRKQDARWIGKPFPFYNDLKFIQSKQRVSEKKGKEVVQNVADEANDMQERNVVDQTQPMQATQSLVGTGSEYLSTMNTNLRNVTVPPPGPQPDYYATAYAALLDLVGKKYGDTVFTDVDVMRTYYQLSRDRDQLHSFLAVHKEDRPLWLWVRLTGQI